MKSPPLSEHRNRCHNCAHGIRDNINSVLCTARRKPMRYKPFHFCAIRRGGRRAWVKGEA